MNFSSPDRVDDVIQRMLETSDKGDRNMARVNSLFNGDPPWTTKEAKKHKVQINCPSQVPPSIMDNARAQWETAMTSRDKFFRATCKVGPPEQRMMHSLRFTRNLATIMKRSRDYMDTINGTGAQVMLHGRGPITWPDQDAWCPEIIGLGDLKIPSRVYASFKNLGYFAVFQRYTPFTLFDSALSDHPDPGWRKSLVKRILAQLKDINTENTDYTRWEFPIEIAEDFKSNSGYWSSDAVPTINAWKFYHRDDSSSKWYLKMILDKDNPGLGQVAKSREWLYDSKEAYADDLPQILQVIYANGCHVAPFRYHSARGLGYRLYDEGRETARLECRFKESALQEMMWVFSNVPAEGRERVESFWLSHMGVLPPGVKWVPANERYRMDLNIVMAAMNQSRQVMSESSSSYVMDADAGQESDRETATKTMARMQQANTMIGNFLVKAYGQAAYVGKEIVRRFLRPNSLNSDVKEFQEMCRKDGIPDEWMTPESWDVDVERVAGNGNRMLAAAMADRLMMQYNRLDPHGQRVAMRLYVEANLDDPDMVDELVAEEKDNDSPTMVAAYRDVGSLMRGLPAPMDRTENQIEYVETLLKAMGALVQQALQVSNGVPSQETVIGLGTMGQEIQKRMQLIAQDPGERQRVKQYGDILGKLMNQVKAFAQRLQEQAQKRGQQLDPEIMAKLQSMQLLAQTQIKIKEATAAQKFRHKELGFQLDQRRRDAESRADILATMHGAQVDAAVTDIKTEADVRNGARRAMASFRDGEGE